MIGDTISVHVYGCGVAAVREAVLGVFSARQLNVIADQPLAAVVDDEDLLPDGDDWYGLIVSGETKNGWVSIYVRDWPDSGLLAQGVSGTLHVAALELWAAEETTWGYTLFDSGSVRDRFAADPRAVGLSPAEQSEYRGRPALLAAPLRCRASAIQEALDEGMRSPGPFYGPAVEAFSSAIGLPFGHAATGYDGFFDNDPDDYVDDLENWREFRHITFQIPPGREGLTE